MEKEELKNYCDMEFQNIEEVMKEIFSLLRPEKSEYTIAEKAAVAAFTVNIYRGIENILKQMLIYDRLDIKDSPEWHEKILTKAGEMGILTSELFQAFSRYLSFRNHFLYTYIFNIKWEELKALLSGMREIIGKFKSEVDEYIQTI